VLLQIVIHILLIMKDGRRRIEIHHLARSELDPLPLNCSILLLTGHLSDRITLEFGGEEEKVWEF